MISISDGWRRRGGAAPKQSLHWPLECLSIVHKPKGHEPIPKQTKWHMIAVFWRPTGQWALGGNLLQGQCRRRISNHWGGDNRYTLAIHYRKIVLCTVKVFYRSLSLATLVKDVGGIIIFSFVQSPRDPGYGRGHCISAVCKQMAKHTKLVCRKVHSSLCRDTAHISCSHIISILRLKCSLREKGRKKIRECFPFSCG